MRNTLASFLSNEVEKNKKIILLTGDLGYGLFDNFKIKYYINCGIAEAGMVGIAAGLSQEGYIPICYSIASFLLPRAFEQIRFFSSYNSKKIIYIGAGGGYLYAESGPTHHSLDDLGLAKLIPDLNVYTPSSPNSFKDILYKVTSLSFHRSSYIQIGKYGESEIKPGLNNPNSTVGILSYGILGAEIYNYILEHNVLVDVLVLESIQPLNKSAIESFFKTKKTIILIEEQFVSSGLYGEISSLITGQKLNLDFYRLGPEHEFLHGVHSKNEIRSKYGYDLNSIVTFVDQNYKGKP
jgi:transketolase